MTHPPFSDFNFWVFDMDGTLTVAAHDFDSIRHELGIETGTPILEAIEKMPEEQAATTRLELHRLEMEVAERTQAQPNAAKLLDSLRHRGAELAILTRNAKDIANVTLQAAGLTQYFTDSQVLGRDECAPKPDPAGIQLLMQRWQSPPGETIMVGDYLFDLQAGRNAKVATAHFDITAQFAWPDLTDYRIDNLAQLLP